MYRGVVRNPGQDGVEFSAPNFHSLREQIRALTLMSDGTSELVIWDEYGNEVFVGTVRRWREWQVRG